MAWNPLPRLSMYNLKTMVEEVTRRWPQSQHRPTVLLGPKNAATERPEGLIAQSKSPRGDDEQSVGLINLMIGASESGVEDEANRNCSFCMV